MSVERVTRAGGAVVYRVRWREGGRNRARAFERKRDAQLFDGEVRRRRAMGSLAHMDAGTETLDDFVTGTYLPAHMTHLAAKTRIHYAALYDHHLAPTLGGVQLRSLSAERIARWQSDRLAAGGGPVAVRQALTLLGAILQRAFEGERIAHNPARLVRKVRQPRREEVRPLAPVTVEAMRAALEPRDGTLISLLAYSGLRPGEALALQWGDVRERTLLVQRALSLGVEADTKTAAHRTVRLLAPLEQDLREWRMASGRPGDRALVFPGHGGVPWGKAAYDSWRRKASGQTRPGRHTGPGRCAGPFARALEAAGVDHARPYDLRHSFASLLLHEGRSVIYVARQLGHDARLTLNRYGHVIDELEDAPQLNAEAAIQAAREGEVPAVYPGAGLRGV